MFVIRYLALVLIVLGFFISFFLFITPYDYFINAILKYIGITGKEDELRQILTRDKYSLIVFFPIIITFIGATTLALQRNVWRVVVETREILINFFSQIKEINAKVLFALIVILSFRFFYAINFPISYDEAWTYINFTEKGLFSSVSYYPAPNNHILYSILTNLTSNLPFGNTINLRLPSLVIGSLSVIVFYLAFKRFFKEDISLGLTLVFSFLYPVIYYGYEARGYSLVIFSFVIIFYASVRILEICKTKSEDVNFIRYWVYITFGSVLGLYSVPSFAYPYFLIVTFLGMFFLRNSNYTHIVSLLISGAVICVITIILYLPVFIVSGVESITNNRFTTPRPRMEVLENLYLHFLDTFQYYFHFKWSLLVLIFLTIFLILKGTGNSKRNLALYIIYASPLILLIHSVIPFTRTWVYLPIPILFLFGLLLSEISRNKIKLYFWPIVVLVVLFLGSSFEKKLRSSEKFEFEARELSSFFISKDVKKIYVNHRLIETYLVYYFKESNASTDVVYSRLNPLSDKIIKPYSFDYLVLDKKFDKVPGYVFFRKLCIACSTYGEDVHIYKRIK